MNAADICPDADLMDDLGADSLDIVEILIAVEAEWGVTIPDDAIPELKTVKLLVAYIESHLAEGSKP